MGNGLALAPRHVSRHLQRELTSGQLTVEGATAAPIFSVSPDIDGLLSWAQL